MPVDGRYSAHLSNVQRLEGGRLAHVQVDVQHTYGPTVTNAVRALEASFDTWRQEPPPNVRDVEPRILMARNGTDRSETVLNALTFLGPAVLVALVLVLAVALGSWAWRIFFSAP